MGPADALATAEYERVLSFDLPSVVRSMAGPSNPHKRLPTADLAARGIAAPWTETPGQMPDGAVIIAAITSCTNTSNPSVMLAAGLVARKAVERGLTVPAYVKTSLAPGSRVVTDYLDKAGLTPYLDAVGFQTVGYGCTTCIGNSGPLPDPVAKAVTEGDLVASAVLSGNRNFEGRVNPLVKANYLASPPLVVAYALAGTTDIDLSSEPLGKGKDGQPVYLKDIWPTAEEVQQVVAQCVLPEMFRERYSNVFGANDKWNALPTSEGDLYDWNVLSTYIQEPPFLVNLTRDPQPLRPIRGARILAALGDSVTTDHISPAGSISAKSPAGKFLQEHGVTPVDFNSYGARRGNDRVMTRGTFANIRIRNQLTPETEGGVTKHFPDGEQMSIYDAAMKYQAEGVPLLILAGAEYGTGSSRDWAAKGTMLLGVRAVLAVSYERIHRSNLVGMGVLPLELPTGETWKSLGLAGDETYDLIGIDDTLAPGSIITVEAKNAAGQVVKSFQCKARIDTPVELDYYRNGGILQTVLRKLLAG